jgi:tetratricopeptide (TPR) repeat protein
MTWTGIAASGLAASIAAGILSPFLAPESRAAREGLERYARGEYVEAVDRFRRSLEQEPDPRIRYNLGSAAYQGQNYPEAAEALAPVVGAEEIPPGNAAYDLGNVLFRSEQLPEALKAYRQALRENPDDADARYNYELTLRRLSGQQSPGEDRQQEETPDPSDGSRDEEQQAPPDSTGQSQPPGGKEDAQEPSPGADPRPEETKEEPSGSQGEAPPPEAAPPDRLLSPEEARRLLNAVTPEERELIQARLQAGQRRRVEKDW